MSGSELSRREKKYRMLLRELEQWGVHDTADGAIRALAGQMTWRTAVRIVNKLERKRHS